MIDEQRTLEIYGYTSDDLKPHSKKHIIVVCGECGIYRVIQKRALLNTKNEDELCKLCAARTPERRQQVSIASIKYWSSDEARYTREKHWEDPDAHEKASMISKILWSSSAFRKNQSEGVEKYWLDQEARDVVSERSKKQWSDPSIRKKISGENSYLWCGGISFGVYCPKFNNTTKQQIRDKYNNSDYISGLPAHICNPDRKLDVHHVDYNKMQGCDEHEWILIPLSHTNHGITNFNRYFWNRLFTYSLQYDETYYIGEDIDIWSVL